ncbi:Cof-type HAD-IIB family hydrolase [Bombilactobacillus thymidiniphilus]|uniref:Cof-type HAD-IIB family hydrolase n=1 Tax=Bombilactobacillus thymidiniphilus TaxID=2923363 RepID=A0ABY4PE86_9LACO|nr:Cof-type HAD-IIB family hydrolase [Bombilactobacillus thymidiniphilus]UQS83857.1 Cof-type HAD-IIB family hydrolase [Bombilactobacillus thymidiniphilus]
MTIKLVAIDVDDTLLNSQGEILNSTKQVIKQALQQGIKVVICSGRPWAGIKIFLQELAIQGLEQYVITFNGGTIATASGKILAQNGITKATYQQIDDYSKQNHLAYNVLDNQSIIYTSNHDVNRITVLQAFENQAGIKIRTPQELSDNVDLIKGAFVGDKMQLDKQEAQVKAQFGQDNYIVRAADNFLEIMHPDVSKGAALRMLAAKLQLSDQEVLAIGDEKNDLAMFDFAGVAVAMGNGSDFVKRQADYVTLTNDEAGIAQAFKKYVLEK